MKIKLFILLLFAISSKVIGQELVDYEQDLYSSYVEGKMKDWKGIIADMKVTYKKEKDRELLYSLSFAQYGYIGYCIDKGMDKEAKESLKDARKNAKELEVLYDGRHDVLALQGAFLGFKIMLSKFSAMYLAPQTFKLINTASASSDKYFNCSMEIGNMRYFTPKFLGGSKEEAIEYYINAVHIIESSLKKEEHNWMYINVLLLLANAYYDTDSKELACQTYERILEYEPRVSKVRDEMNKRCKN